MFHEGRSNNMATPAETSLDDSSHHSGEFVNGPG